MEPLTQVDYQEWKSNQEGWVLLVYIWKYTKRLCENDLQTS